MPHWPNDFFFKYLFIKMGHFYLSSPITRQCRIRMSNQQLENCWFRSQTGPSRRTDETPPFHLALLTHGRGICHSGRTIFYSPSYNPMLNTTVYFSWQRCKYLSDVPVVPIPSTSSLNPWLSGSLSACTATMLMWLTLNWWDDESFCPPPESLCSGLWV